MRVISGFTRKQVWFLVLGALVAASGCGDSSKGSLSGSVSFRGQDLKGGRVTFINDKQETFPAEIEDNGKYEILNIPSGDYKVCVETEYLKPTAGMVMVAKSRPADAGEGQGPDVSGQTNSYTAIPPKYGTADQTPLKCTVKGGNQGHDIKLD